MAAKKAALTLRHAILCDQLRREDNGKFIHIGVYTEGVTFHVKPTVFSGVLLFAFDIGEDRTGRLELELSVQTRSSTASYDLAEIPTAMSLAMIQHNVEILVDEPSDLSFRHRLAGGNWSSSIHWSLRFAPDAALLSTEEREALNRAIASSG